MTVPFPPYLGGAFGTSQRQRPRARCFFRGSLPPHRLKRNCLMETPFHRSQVGHGSSLLQNNPPSLLFFSVVCEVYIVIFDGPGEGLWRLARFICDGGDRRTSTFLCTLRATPCRGARVYPQVDVTMKFCYLYLNGPSIHSFTSPPEFRCSPTCKPKVGTPIFQLRSSSLSVRA